MNLFKNHTCPGCGSDLTDCTSFGEVGEEHIGGTNIYRYWHRNCWINEVIKRKQERKKAERIKKIAKARRRLRRWKKTKEFLREFFEYL